MKTNKNYRVESKHSDYAVWSEGKAERFDTLDAARASVEEWRAYSSDCRAAAWRVVATDAMGQEHVAAQWDGHWADGIRSATGSR